MSGRVDRTADLGNPAGDAGRGLVVNDEDRTNPVGAIGREPLVESIGVGSTTPGSGDELDQQAQALGYRAPLSREMPVVERENLVPGREGVDERRLPRAGAR